MPFPKGPLIWAYTTKGPLLLLACSSLTALSLFTLAIFGPPGSHNFFALFQRWVCGILFQRCILLGDLLGQKFPKDEELVAASGIAGGSSSLAFSEACFLTSSSFCSAFSCAVFKASTCFFQTCFTCRVLSCLEVPPLQMPPLLPSVAVWF